MAIHANHGHGLGVMNDHNTSDWSTAKEAARVEYKIVAEADR